MQSYKEVTKKINSRKESLSMATAVLYPKKSYDLTFDYLSQTGNKERTVLHIDLETDHVKVVSCYDYDESKTRYNQSIESGWYDMPDRRGKKELVDTVIELLSGMKLFYDDYRYKTYYAN